MGLFSKSAPAAPDPVATAQAQGAANEATARLQQKMNMVNYSGPEGTVNYSPIGDDRYQKVVTLSPDQQNAYNKESQLTNQLYGLANDQFGRVADAMGSNFDWNNVQPLPGSGDFAADREKVSGDMFASLAKRLDDQYGREGASLENKLLNQGIAPGSEAYTNAMKDFNYGKTDAYDAANRTATQMGMQDQQNLFSMAMARRNQDIQDKMTDRNMPINEIAALLGTGQVNVPQGVQYTPTNVQGTDVLGAYQLYNNAINQKNQSSSSLWGSLAGLGGSLGSSWMMASALSDRRLKTNIRVIGKGKRGLPLYRFSFKGSKSRFTGYMADEVEKVVPEAVYTAPDGFKRVRYWMI